MDTLRKGYHRRSQRFRSHRPHSLYRWEGSRIAVWQDVTGNAKKKAVALGIGIGSGYLFETTFEEVYLYGECGVVRSHIYLPFTLL
jgi:hypothetical protein